MTKLFAFIFNPCLHVKQNNVHCYGEGFRTGTSTNMMDLVEDFSKRLCSPVLMLNLYGLFAETRLLKTFPTKRQLGPWQSLRLFGHKISDRGCTMNNRLS